MGRCNESCFSGQMAVHPSGRLDKHNSLHRSMWVIIWIDVMSRVFPGKRLSTQLYEHNPRHPMIERRSEEWLEMGMAGKKGKRWSLIWRFYVTLHEMSWYVPDGHFHVFIFCESKFYAIYNGENHFQIRGLVAELHAFEYGGTTFATFEKTCFKCWRLLY